MDSTNKVGDFSLGSGSFFLVGYTTLTPSPFFCMIHCLLIPSLSCHFHFSLCHDGVSLHDLRQNANEKNCGFNAWSIRLLMVLQTEVG
jgi:hypothetical protein